MQVSRGFQNRRGKETKDNKISEEISGDSKENREPQTEGGTKLAEDVKELSRK